ncbi:hypothetical protein ABPG73_008471, partial [Tetrahymena malaccensis]
DQMSQMNKSNLSAKIQNNAEIENEEIKIGEIDQLFQVSRQKTMEIKFSEISNEEIKLLTDTFSNHLSLSSLTLKFDIFDRFRYNREEKGGLSLANMIQEQKILTNLVLSFGELGQEEVTQITDSLKMLNSLVSLSLTVYLQYNHDNFKVGQSVADSLVLLKNLTCLNLELFEREKEGAIQITDSLKMLNSLVSLSLKVIFDFEYNDEEFIYLVNSIKNCSQITNLGFEKRNLSESQLMNNLVDTLYNLKDLNELTLDFTCCNFKELKGILQSNDMDGNHNKMTKLSVNFEFKGNSSFNNIGVLGTQYLSQSLEKLQDLLYLNLNMSWNKIGPKGAQQISFCLQKCLKLYNLSLNLSGCQIELEGIKYIVESLQKCKKIVILDLWFDNNDYQNYDQDQIEIKKIEKMILKMKRLTRNYFYNDQF